MTLLECTCDNCGCTTGTDGEPPEYCGNCGLRLGDDDVNVVTQHLSDRAVEYAEAHIGEDIQMGAVVVPPVPRDKVKEVVQEYEGASDDTFDNPVAGHLYDLTDLSLAINHSGDPMLDHSVESAESKAQSSTAGEQSEPEDDEDKYNVTRETLAEIKVARGALFSAFNRELSALADRLGIDSDQEDLVSAIRDEVGYDVDTSVDEDWPEPDDE